MAKKRKSRDNINKQAYDLLKPIDPFSLGSLDDPCFGKHHDLLAKECVVCGDSEFCSIVTLQTLKVNSAKMETTQRFKDKEEAELTALSKKEKAIELIQSYREKGLKNYKILLKVWEETKLTKEEVKNLLNT